MWMLCVNKTTMHSGGSLCTYLVLGTTVGLWTRTLNLSYLFIQLRTTFINAYHYPVMLFRRTWSPTWTTVALAVSVLLCISRPFLGDDSSLFMLYAMSEQARWWKWQLGDNCLPSMSSYSEWILQSLRCLENSLCNRTFPSKVEKDTKHMEWGTPWSDKFCPIMVSLIPMRNKVCILQSYLKRCYRPRFVLRVDTAFENKA